MSNDDVLKWIDQNQQEMTRLLIEWSQVNSGTFNVAGLAKMERMLLDAFSSLADTTESIPLPPASIIGPDGISIARPLGRALRFVKRAGASRRVLLNIHYDTVFPADSPFQHARMVDSALLCGPGVADAKGGIIVLLTALRALEQSDVGQTIGWEVLLNPDEEIGSPSSAALLVESAGRNHIGLVFEPAFPDGSLVSARKGSGTYVLVVRGRAAHAGRHFADGRNAIVALAQIIAHLGSGDREGVIINCGKIEGGGAVNIVPDLAIGRFNVRADSKSDQQWLEMRFCEEATRAEETSGIRVDVQGGFLSPPKPLDARSEDLMNQFIEAGAEIGLKLAHRPSGGASDGNKLAAAGLPVVDSLGPVGGELHSDREYIQIRSLAERAKLVALFLTKRAGRWRMR